MIWNNMSSFQIIPLYLQNWVHYTEYTLYYTITTLAGRFIGVGWTLQILVTFTALETYAETMTLETHSVTIPLEPDNKKNLPSLYA